MEDTGSKLPSWITGEGSECGHGYKGVIYTL